MNFLLHQVTNQTNGWTYRGTAPQTKIEHVLCAILKLSALFLESNTYTHTQGFYKAPFHKDRSANINNKVKI